MYVTPFPPWKLKAPSLKSWVKLCVDDDTTLPFPGNLLPKLWMQPSIELTSILFQRILYFGRLFMHTIRPGCGVAGSVGGGGELGAPEVVRSCRNMNHSRYEIVRNWT